MSACFCLGPQRGEPLCPCQMRRQNVQQKDGRWYEGEKDLGPVIPESEWPEPYIMYFLDDEEAD